MTDGHDDVIEPGAAAGTTLDGLIEPAAAPAIDLDRIERDLEGVAAALARLDDDTYWTDEVTGAPLVAELLVVDPVARRNA